MNSQHEEHVPTQANGSADEADGITSPASVPQPVEPFTPVRRSMWRHFTHGLRHYADFGGRATRAEYWSFQAWSEGITLLLMLLAAGVFSVLFFWVLKEAVGTGEMARYVEVASTEGMTGLTRELVESAPVMEDGTGGASALADAVEGGFVLPGSQAQAPWIAPMDEPDGSAEAADPDEEGLEAYIAWVECLKDGYARLAEESVYPAILLLSGLALMIISCLWSLGTLIPSLAVTWRRLHDINLSGAWFFLGLTPYVGNLIVLTMVLIDSKRGANRFGPPTKYP